MLRPYIVGVLTLLLAFGPRTCVRAQTYLQQSFEGTGDDDLPYSSDVGLTGSGLSPTWNVVTGLPGITAAAAGDHFFGAINTGGDPYTLTFDAGDICHLTSAAFTFAYYAVGLDGGDAIHYELLLDGFGQGRRTAISGRNAPTGPVSSGGWQTVTVGIPGTATTARLAVTVDQNGAADYVGIDHVRLTATGTSGSCTDACGLDIDADDVTYHCGRLTDGADPVTATVAYRGGDPGATVTVSGGSVGGDDPATVQNGELSITGLTEGSAYRLTVTGGGCAVDVPLRPPADQCVRGGLLINEICASPSASEFVELVNGSDTRLDITGYTFEDATGNAQRIDRATSALEPGEYLVVRLGSGVETSGCPTVTLNGIGLNDGGDLIVVRNAAGQVIDQYDYGAEGGGAEALVRIPSGDPEGSFWLNRSELGNADPASPCAENVDNSAALPIELTELGARARGKVVRVFWRTVGERDNAGFLVERSRSGQQFIPVGWVAADPEAGRGGAAYAFVDERPLDGLSYYRLLQEDTDGGTTSYGPVAVETTGAGPRLAPNPATETVALSGMPDGIARIRLLSATGRVLREVAPRARELWVGYLPPGSYFLRIDAARGTQTLRFVRR